MVTFYLPDAVTFIYQVWPPFYLPGVVTFYLPGVVTFYLPGIVTFCLYDMGHSVFSDHEHRLGVSQYYFIKQIEITVVRYIGGRQYTCVVHLQIKSSQSEQIYCLHFYLVS